MEKENLGVWCLCEFLCVGELDMRFFLACQGEKINLL